MTSSEGNEFRGKTPEEATETGLAALKLRADQVEIEVLSKGSRGLLGFGAEDARVKITPIGKMPSKQSPPEKKASPPPPAAKAPPESKPQPTEAPKPPPKPSSKAGQTGLSRSQQRRLTKMRTLLPLPADLLQGMLDRMGINATVQTVEYRGVLDEGQDRAHRSQHRRRRLGYSHWPAGGDALFHSVPDPADGQPPVASLGQRSRGCRGLSRRGVRSNWLVLPAVWPSGPSARESLFRWKPCPPMSGASFTLHCVTTRRSQRKVREKVSTAR